MTLCNVAYMYMAWLVWTWLRSPNDLVLHEADRYSHVIYTHARVFVSDRVDLYRSFIFVVAFHSFSLVILFLFGATHQGVYMYIFLVCWYSSKHTYACTKVIMPL